MADPLIEFHCITEVSHIADLPRPIPASQAAPAWLKEMPGAVPRDEVSDRPTVKKCPPVVDALTGGYLIPLVADIAFTMEEKGLRFRCDLPLIDGHSPEQVKGSAFESEMAIVKFMNPWIVKTPPGYSCLFTNPLNRFDLPFNMIAGIVETDRYYHEVNFPSVCLLKPGQTFAAKRGTPLVQVIPFKRESWSSDWAVVDAERREQVRKAIAGEKGFYRGNLWQRKAFD